MFTKTIRPFSWKTNTFLCQIHSSVHNQPFFRHCENQFKNIGVSLTQSTTFSFILMIKVPVGLRTFLISSDIGINYSTNLSRGQFHPYSFLRAYCIRGRSYRPDQLMFLIVSFSCSERISRQVYYRSLLLH